MGDDYLQWNIRGIQDKERRKGKIDKIVTILSDACALKVLNIQETHLVSTEDEPSSFRNFRHLFHIIHNFAPPEDIGSGITIFINKTENIVCQENLIRGRLSYIKLCNVASNKIQNIFSYYGKSRNSQEDWKHNFEAIQDKIQSNQLVNNIIMGDFNFVTSVLDRNSQKLNTIDNLAMPSWNEFIDNTGLIDSFRITNPKRRLYTYYHTDNRSKSRIDRIYLDIDFSARVEATNFEISHYSDHKLIRLRIGNSVERGPGSWIFNNTLLKDDIFIAKMKNEIREATNIKHTYTSKRAFWDYLKMNIQSVSIMYSAEKSKEQKWATYKINKEIEELEQIPTNLLTDFSINKLSTLKKKLLVFENEKINGMKLRSKIPKHDFGEPSISYLAKLEKMSGERNTIYSLKDKDGVLRAGKECLLEITENFYKKLYTKEFECEIEQIGF